MTREPIGIFTFGTSPIEHMKPPRTRALLAEAALQGADLLLFAAADCDTQAGTVLANVWNGSDFERREAPLPALVMILTNPITPRHHEVEAWLRAKTRVIADHGPDKLGQVRLLEQSPLAPYAIPTATLTPENLKTQLTDWLSIHRAAVVKAVDGERGSNIHFIFPVGDRWGLQKRGETREGTLEEVVEALGSAIAPRMRYRRFMIQRYIESSHAGRALGMRVDVHKKPDGGWGFTHSVARISMAGSFATHVASGGAQTTLEKFLPSRTVRHADQIKQEAIAVACRTAELIDSQPDASIIELGVDFALDPDDRLWIVEANVHPGAHWAEHDRAVHMIAYLLSLVR